MTSQEAVTLLLSSGAIITADGDQLQIDAPRGILTPSICGILSKDKAIVLAMLKAKSMQLSLVAVHPQRPTLTDRAQWGATLDAEIAACRAERDRFAERFDKGADYLDAMQARGESETTEFARLFAEWEKINHAYMTAEDRLLCLEMTERIRREGNNGKAYKDQGSD